MTDPILKGERALHQQISNANQNYNKNRLKQRCAAQGVSV